MRDAIIVMAFLPGSRGVARRLFPDIFVFNLEFEVREMKIEVRDGGRQF
jgi:hypothetical protein